MQRAWMKQHVPVHRVSNALFKRFPDTQTVPFSPPTDVSDEKAVELMLQEFRRGLYFAKLIPLASGGSLFDFISKCSNGFTNADYAQDAFDAAKRSAYFYLHYRVTLRRVSDGKEIELTFAFDRTGDTVIANSAVYASQILVDPAFLSNQGLMCWRDFNPLLPSRFKVLTSY